MWLRRSSLALGRPKFFVLRLAILSEENSPFMQIPFPHRTQKRLFSSAFSQKREKASTFPRPAMRSRSRLERPRVHVEIGQPDAIGAEAIQFGRAQPWVAVARLIAVALVIRKDDDDVGFDDRCCPAFSTVIGSWWADWRAVIRSVLG